MNDEMRNVEREIRAWAARAPARPPGAARTRVLARLGEPRGLPWWRLAAATMALVLALGSGFLLLGPEAPTGLPPAVVPATEPPAPGLLVYELRSGTKLYLALTSSRTAAEPPAAGTYQR